MRLGLLLQLYGSIGMWPVLSRANIQNWKNPEKKRKIKENENRNKVSCLSDLFETFQHGPFPRDFFKFSPFLMYFSPPPPPPPPTHPSSPPPPPSLNFPSLLSHSYSFMAAQLLCHSPRHPADHSRWKRLDDLLRRSTATLALCQA